MKLGIALTIGGNPLA
jgi:hypothetical protein